MIERFTKAVQLLDTKLGSYNMTVLDSRPFRDDSRSVNIRCKSCGIIDVTVSRGYLINASFPPASGL